MTPDLWLALGQTIALGLLYAIADAWDGGGLGWNKLAHDHGGPLHGHPWIYTVLPLAGLSYLIAGLPALVVALAWSAWRGVLGFPDGTITARRHLATIGRIGELMIVPVVLIYSFHKPWAVLLPYLAYAVLAYVLQKFNGDEALDSEHPHDINWIIEPVRGWVFGLATAFAVLPTLVASLH